MKQPIGHISYIKLQSLLLIQSRVINLINYQSLIMKPCWERQNLQKKENLGVVKKWPYIKSKCLCPSLLTETNLFFNTKAYPFLSLGTKPSNLKFTLFGCEAVKLSWCRKSKTYNLKPTSSILTFEDLKSLFDFYDRNIPPFDRALKGFFNLTITLTIKDENVFEHKSNMIFAFHVFVVS